MKRSIDVVFVNPGNLRQVYQGLADTHSAIEPPIFAATMATYVRKKGYSVAIIDAPAEALSSKDVANRVYEVNPRLVVMAVYGFQPSASTQNMPAARATCQAIRNLTPNIPILITGTHPAALPERTLREEPVDYVCDGEGPITIVELLAALKTANGDYSNVRGLWHWVFGVGVERNAPAPLIQDFDESMPGAAWDLLPMERYRAHNWQTGYGSLESRMPYASILTSFGCPFKCSFCCIQAPFKRGEQAIGLPASKNSYRLRDPKTVIREIDLLVNTYGVRIFKIHDEMFVLHPKHVLEICRLIHERFGDSLNIWAYTRVDTTQERFLADLRNAGFSYLGVGIESADSTVRDGQDKDFKEGDIERVIARIKAAGISVGGNFIFGLPHDTAESIEKTFQMALALKPELLNIYCAMAYPGSALYAQAKVSGIALPDDPGGPGWIGYSQHSYECLPLATETVSAREVLRLRDEAFNRYYNDAGVRAMLLERFGAGALSHIDTMLQIPLRRKLLEG